MVTITKSDTYEGLGLVIDNGTDYMAIRRALEFFRDAKVERMNPEERLLDVIADGPAQRIVASEILEALRSQESSMPIFIRAKQEAEDELEESFA